MTAAKTEAEVARGKRGTQLESVRAGRVTLQQQTCQPGLSHLEQHGCWLNVLSASIFGMAYGSLRGYARGWWQAAQSSKSPFPRTILLCTDPLRKALVSRCAGRDPVRLP